MSKLLILIVGVVILLVLGLAWILDQLIIQAKKVHQSEEALLARLALRRDTLPYLIESYRGVEKTPTPLIEKIIEKRAEIREAKGFQTVWKKEQEMEVLMAEWVNGVKGESPVAEDIGWLEARKEMDHEWDELDREEKQLRETLKNLQSRLGRFPFVMFKKMVEKRL